MGEVLQANIFFFITAASVIILTVFLAIVFYHFIKIVRSVRRIIERIEEGSEVVIEDLQNVRGAVMGTSAMLSHLLGFKASMREATTEKSKTRKKKKRTKLSIIDESD